MIDLIRPLQSLVKLQTVHIDNIIFYVHYKTTVTFLIAFSILVASRQYFGEPIDCEFPKYPQDYLNNYCYVQATFVRERSGIYSHSPHAEEEHVRYYGYYSWVSIALFVQAVLFYIPRYMWKGWEGGKLKHLSVDIRSPILSDECIEVHTERLLKYLYMQLHTHNSYAYKYFFCELLNLINLVGQIIFLKRFIGEGFQSYGIDVIFSKYENKENGFVELFPLRTLCAFEKYGGTGVKRNLEGICLLSHNPLNEKIYGFLWFWMCFLAIINIVLIIYRITTLFSSSFRLRVLRFMSTMNKEDEINSAFEQLQIGDWFILILIQKNINQQIYKKLVSDLARHKSDVKFPWTSALDAELLERAASTASIVDIECAKLL